MSQDGKYVFVSYKTEERDFAQQVRANLALALKCDVWWDQDLQTGGQWSADLDKAVRNAASVVVLWSKKSSASPWVQQEAAIAKGLGTLSPAKIEDCQIPAPYLGVQAAKLKNWDFRETHPEFVKLAARVQDCLDRSPAGKSELESISPPSELENRSLWWWLQRFSPTHIRKSTGLLAAFAALVFNIGAWVAGLNLPYVGELPWFPASESQGGGGTSSARPTACFTRQELMAATRTMENLYNANLWLELNKRGENVTHDDIRAELDDALENAIASGAFSGSLTTLTFAKGQVGQEENGVVQRTLNTAIGEFKRLIDQEDCGARG